jgi:hemerythrin-like domain-containing protein
MRGTGMWLYEKKITELEEEFENARAIIREVQEILENTERTDQKISETPDRAKLKLKLDTAFALARLIKEQAAFYMKIGDLYDAFKLLKDLIDEFRKEDDELTDRVLDKIDNEWDCGISYLLRKINAEGNKKADKA